MSDNDAVDTDLETSSFDSDSNAGLEAVEDNLDTDSENNSSSQRDSSRDGQLRRAEKLLAQGKELPESLKWTLKELKQDEPKPNIDLATIKAELKDDSMYEKGEDELKGLGLNKEEMASFKAKYQLYKSKGFRKGEALSETLEIWRLKNATSKAKVSASVPDSSGFKDGDTPSWENYANLSQKDRLKLLSQVR
jgi:hypothetical protein